MEMLSYKQFQYKKNGQPLGGCILIILGNKELEHKILNVVHQIKILPIIKFYLYRYHK